MPVNNQGEGITQGCEYQDSEVTGGHLGGYLLHCPRQTAELKFYTKPPSPLFYNFYLVNRQRWDWRELCRLVVIESIDPK